MDAFESIVAKVLENDGYWVRQGVKVECTPKEKEKIGGKTIPTPEVDLVAYNSKECILIEVKSFLDSDGVKFGGVSKSNKVDGKKYKLINHSVYQKMMTAKILEAYKIPKNIKVIYGLAAGKIYGKDYQKIVNYFNSRNRKDTYRLYTPDEIADKVINLGKKVYINEEVTMTVKLLKTTGKLK